LIFYQCIFQSYQAIPVKENFFLSATFKDSFYVAQVIPVKQKLLFGLRPLLLNMANEEFPTHDHNQPNANSIITKVIPVKQNCF